jgi:hypothetical protein
MAPAGSTDVVVDYCPLTVIVGPSASGKTTFINTEYGDEAVFATLEHGEPPPDGQLVVIDDHTEADSELLKCVLETNPVVVVVQSLENIPVDLLGEIICTYASRSFRIANTIVHYDGVPPDLENPYHD